MTVNSKEENSLDFCPNYVQEFSLWFPEIYDLTGLCTVPTYPDNNTMLGLGSGNLPRTMIRKPPKNYDQPTSQELWSAKLQELWSANLLRTVISKIPRTMISQPPKNCDQQNSKNHDQPTSLELWSAKLQELWLANLPRTSISSISKTPRTMISNSSIPSDLALANRLEDFHRFQTSRNMISILQEKR